MGVLADVPELVAFEPRATTDIERRIERYIFRYHARTNEWPRVGQVMSTTRQNSAELLEVVRRSKLFEMRSADDQASAWKQRNGGLLAANIIVLLYQEINHEANEVAVLPDSDRRHSSS